MSSSIPKAVLYYSPNSVWSAVALLALHEKGYGDDEVDLKVVDISKGKDFSLAPLSYKASQNVTGENFSPSFLRLNPKATVPTLVVPLENTLGPDTESRYRAITDVKSVIEFLDKSRSVVSRTNTTSPAPAPALAPATIAFSEVSSKIIDDILHSEGASPNTLRYLNARNDTSLQALGKLVPFFISRQQALRGYIAEAGSGTTPISEKTKAFWKEKMAATETLLNIMVHADKTSAQLDEAQRIARDDYFANAKSSWEVGLKENLVKLNAEIVGPYSLGDQISIADLHLVAWLARVVVLSGGRINDEGDVVITKVESHIGTDFHLVKNFASLSAASDAPRKHGSRPMYQSKLAAFWDAMRVRSSFKKVYANGLY